MLNMYKNILKLIVFSIFLSKSSFLHASESKAMILDKKIEKTMSFKFFLYIFDI